MGFFKTVTGVMGCGKSTRFISDYKSLKFRGCSITAIKSVLDTRDGKEIKSRNMSETVVADYLLDKDSLIPTADIVLNKINYIMVDEAQFLTPAQIMELYKLSTNPNVNVCLYGLRMCWKGTPFHSMQLAISMADEIDVIRVYDDRGVELTHQVITKDGIPLEINEDSPEIYIGDLQKTSNTESIDTEDSTKKGISYSTVTKAEFYSIYPNLTVL